jgi:proteasome accessory factor C
MSISERLSRLLFIVPYVASRDGVPVAELADKLGVKAGQIEADIELLSMVGQPPLTPDHLIDLYIEDEVVYVDLDQSLSRPPRLTHEEARALVLGAKLVGSQGGLGTAVEAVLQRIAKVLNPVDQEALRTLSQRVAVGEDALTTVPSAELRRAVDAHREVELDYYSASSDQKKRYRVRPLALITHSGVEYLVALDVNAELHEKLFRLDRMGPTELLETTFVPPDTVDLERYRTTKLYAGDGGTSAEVRFAAKVAALVDDRFEETKKGKDGSVTVRLATSSQAWLARWVLPFGEDAEVVGPAEARAALHKICSEAAEVYSGAPRT